MSIVTAIRDKKLLSFTYDGYSRVVDGVSFKEARSVFSDERAKLIDDPDHSEEENRFILLGLSSTLRVLVVAIAIARRAMSFESSQLERRQPRN